MKVSAGTRLAWALGSETRCGFKVRRVVWGRLMARYEKRDGEKILRVSIAALPRVTKNPLVHSSRIHHNKPLPEPTGSGG